MNRPQTDFLCATSSFLMGVGSILNLSGQQHAYNACENPDEIAIANDWRMAGQDVQDAMDKAAKERVERPKDSHERKPNA